MLHTRRQFIGYGISAAIVRGAFAQDAQPWPPVLPGVANNTVTLRTDRFLEIPESARTGAMQDGAAQFIVARTPPTVDLAFHGNLGSDAAARRLWSSWGDICVARDGKVYCAIGDHGNDVGGDARCFLYRWDPARKTLEQIVDMNRVVPPQPGQPAWSKVHAKLDEGADGKIYFSCTLNDGNRAGLATHRWTERLPGGQIYRYDPANGQTSVVADLPRCTGLDGAARCTATSLLDRERNTWWCNLEVGDNAIWGVNLETRRPVFQAPDGSTKFNRAFTLLRDGSILFNGDGGLWKYDLANRRLVRTRCSFENSPGMRSATGETRDGCVYGTSHQSGQLFRYRVARDELEILGPAWLRGDYVTVCVPSPDERFIYYLPGAHGQATRTGTPVMQFEIASGRRKVLAFLAPAFEQAHEYVPAGTYGVKLSADGGTLYVNFNGHPIARHLPRHLRPNGFGLTSFAAIQIPASER